MTTKKVNKFLEYLAVGGGITGLLVAGYLTQTVQDKFKHGEYYTKPMKLLRHYKPAVEKLGEPITSRFIHLNKDAVTVDELNAKLTIPVKGPKDKAKMYVVAGREKPEDSWNIKTLDIELASTGKRWTFYKAPDS